MAIVWILKVRQRDEYDYSHTFETKADAEHYIFTKSMPYYIPVRAEIILKLRDDDATN